MDEERETRSGEEAIQEIRESDDEPDAGEREFLESEGVRLDPDDEGGRPVA